MKKPPYKIRAFFLCICLYGLFGLSGCASNVHKKADGVYLSSPSPMQDIETALANAETNEKLLLIVLGAQWCHDSTGLAENFSQAKLADFLNAHYEVIYIDVGYFKDLRPITKRFGQAHYFATPTVMIVDPSSEQLINDKDLAMWGNADSIPFETYVSYFTKYSEIDTATFKSRHSAISTEHILAILDFENRQAERLQYAYGILVPDMIKEDIGDKVEASFYDRWTEVRKYRTNLQRDIQALYLQAENSPNRELNFPEYPAFSWEK